MKERERERERERGGGWVGLCLCVSVCMFVAECLCVSVCLSVLSLFMSTLCPYKTQTYAPVYMHVYVVVRQMSDRYKNGGEIYAVIQVNEVLSERGNLPVSKLLMRGLSLKS